MTFSNDRKLCHTKKNHEVYEIIGITLQKHIEQSEKVLNRRD